MNKFRVAALTFVGALVLMGASECNVGGRKNSETCEVTARDTTTLTLTCEDKDGKLTGGGGKKNIPSDLYPRCQIGTYWPGCKTAK